MRSGFERPRDAVATTGRCTITLANSDRRFSPGNALSPLAGKLLPGRPVRVLAVDGSETVPLFYGFITRIAPGAGAQGSTCAITCVDGLAVLAQTRVGVPHEESKLVAAAIQELVGAAYSPPAFQVADNGDGLTHYGRHWLPEHTTTRDALWDVCRAVYGRFWIARDGSVRAWSRREQQVPAAGPALVIGDYWERVLSIRPANLIGYWPLWETQGVTVTDQGENGLDGTATGVAWGQPGIGDGLTAPRFDGAGDAIDLSSPALGAAFDGDEGTLLLWLKPAHAALWGDGVTRYALDIRVDGNNRVSCHVDGSGYLRVARVAGGVARDCSLLMTGVGDGWQCVMATWSRQADALKLYRNGTPAGSPASGLLAFAGAPGVAVIGADSMLAQGWYGCIGHVALWNVALDEREIAMLGVV